jgi:hypothetical protein
MRFLDALRRTSVAGAVALVDVTQLTEQQRSSVKAVPTLYTEGVAVVGTKAFEWLKQYEADVDLESFSGNGSLAFSEVSSMGYAAYSDDFGPFEPVP